MEVEIGKWGNSLGLRIPMHLVKELSLRVGEKAELFAEDGRLVLKRKLREYTLEELVAGITPDNIHTSVDLGSPIGKEEI